MILQPIQLSPAEIQEFLKKNQKIFNPDVLNANLLFYSTYIAIFELFKKEIIFSIKDYFCHNFRNGKEIESEEYKKEIKIRLDKNKEKNDNALLRASLAWLFEHELITTDEYKWIDRIVKYRNIAAHEMAIQIHNENIKPDIEVLLCLYNLWSNISYRWFVNFELALGIEGLENFEISYEEYSKFNPFALVWLYQNFYSTVEINKDGFLSLKGKDATHE